MLQALVITLREGLEAALTVGIILTFLSKSRRTASIPYVWVGVILALGMGVAGTYLFQRFAVNEELFEGVTYLLSALLVLSFVIWLHSKSKNYRAEIEAIAARQTKSGIGEGLGLFLFSFIMVGREGLETMAFLSALTFTTADFLRGVGALAGLLLATGIGFLFFSGSIKISFSRFFTVTTFVLYTFIAQLLLNGFHELGEAGVFKVGPAEMAIVGPLVANSVFFNLGIILIPIFYLIALRRDSQQTEQILTQPGPERRLRLSVERRNKLVANALVLSSMTAFVLLILNYFFIGKPRAIDPPEMVEVKGETINLNTAKMSTSDSKSSSFFGRFGVELDGKIVRMIMVSESPGKFVVAIDACELCGDEGYYMDKDGSLVCLTCDARINKNTLRQGGGCNPVPITFKQTGNSIEVPVAELRKNAYRFKK